MGLWLAPGAAAAGDEATPDPFAEYRVAGVPDDDELNVRAQPGAQANIVEELAPDATGILATGVWRPHAGGTWWEIAYEPGETAWVNARFLAPAGGPAEHIPLRCSGTEPFWSLAIEDDEAVFSRMGGDEETWTAGERIGAEGFLSGHRFAIPLDRNAPAEPGRDSAAGQERDGLPPLPVDFQLFGASLSDHLSREQDRRAERSGGAARGWITVARTMDHCTDGMSENRYPFDAIAITPSEEDVFAGCCARAP